MTIRVLLADDQALIRSGFRVLIESDPELEVVGEATNGKEAVELARSTRADVIVMDVRMRSQRSGSPARTWPAGSSTRCDTSQFWLKSR